MAGLTKRTIENFTVADRAIIYPCGNIFLLGLFHLGNVAYVSDKIGPVNFISVSAAQRLVSRLRPGLTVELKGGE